MSAEQLQATHARLIEELRAELDRRAPASVPSERRTAPTSGIDRLLRAIEERVS